VKVRFTPAGGARFLSVVDYIRRDSATAARSFRARVETSLRRLERFPDSGPPIPEFDDVPYREIVVGSYRFFYRTEGPTAWVVGVWHGAQIPTDPEAAVEPSTKRPGTPRRPRRKAT
jgi:plasmid stabilization system protein ParE